MNSTLFSKHTSFINRPEVLTLEQYLDLCKNDKLAYATASERMLAAIGESRIIDTSTEPRWSRIFSNKKIRVYDAFKDFFGIEDSIERIVSYFRHSAQGLEESKQILYLKGPVGSSKSSLVERLKVLMQKHPIYILYDESEKNSDLKSSPVFESPLALFASREEVLEQEYGIPRRYVANSVLSGWAQQKLIEFGGDITKFKVLKIYPDKDAQIGIMKVEPGDENNQDVSVLIGKTDIRKLESYPQNHPYSYSYSGGLNRTTQGFLDYAEMFKSNIKTLNPLLMATQEHNYNGTENIPAMPYNGIICAHSNEAEWFKFRNDKSNEAFLDRVYIVNVPYCLRVDEELKIYEKMLSSSSLKYSPCAPQTLKSLAEFMVLTRLREPQNSTIYAKMKVYNGENVKDTMPMAKPYDEYKDAAGIDEGMTGLSTRFGFKIISQTFNLRPEEVQANPIDLMYVLEEALKREHLPQETHDTYKDFIKSWVHPRYFEFIDKELRIAYLESYSDFGQTMFERYVLFAEAWLDESTVRDPETHTLLNRENLNSKLEEIEKAAGIVNAKDFRNDIVHYVLRYRAKNEGKMPAWNSYEKIKIVIEKKMFAATAEIMPVVSFSPKGSSEEQKKHDAFVDRMRSKGYTDRQIRTLVDWWISNRKN
jgi:serine protein kinase